MNKVRLTFAACVALLVAACASAPTQPKGPDLTGNWTLTTTSQMGAQDADMTVQQTGNQLAGKLISPQGTVDYTGTLQGDAIEFNFLFDAGGQSLKLDYSGVVQGDTMNGKAVFGEFGEGTFTAKRKGS
jgi:hypothetical protein